MKSFFPKASRLCAMICLMVFTCSALSAQQQHTYTLSSLVDSAKGHLPILLQKQALANSAKANITDARNSFLPKLNVGDEVSIGSANDVTGTYLPFGGIIHATSGGIRSENNYAGQTGNIASVYAEYDLINFGLRGAKVNNAIAYADVQQADFDKETYVIKAQVGRLYFNMLKNIYLLQVDQQNINRYQSVYTIISALTGSGIKPGADSSQARSEISKTRVSYNQRRGQIRQMQQQLSFLTGINAADINIDTARKDDQIEAEKAFSTMPDTANNPLLAYYVKQKTLYQSAEKLVKKSYLPKIVLAGGGWARGSSIAYGDDYRSLNTGLGYQRYNYAAGVAITYDLFNVVHRKNKLAVNRYQTQASEFDLKQQVLVLHNAQAQANEAIKTAELNLKELPIQLQSATDTYNQKVAQYKAGVINLIDLTNASFLLYTAQVNYIETLNDWYTANLDKAASGGNLDLFIQNIKK
jgi:outer membrane protein TolC